MMIFTLTEDQMDQSFKQVVDKRMTQENVYQMDQSYK